MRNIVVPTDFSDNALVALKYAVSIANKFGSTIHLVNGIENSASAGIYTEVNKVFQETAMMKLTDVVNKEARSLDNLSLMVAKALRGEITDAICDYADKVHADLIVMGTQGASGLKEIFIGTTALGVIKNAKIAVLVIPKNTELKEPKNISLALDDQNITSADVVVPFKKIVNAFKAQASIFHFNKEYVTTNIDPDIEEYLSDLNFSIHDQYSDEKDINKVINDYVKKEEVDLLAMIRRRRSFLANLFHKSITTKEAFHSPVPLLVLHDKL